MGIVMNKMKLSVFAALFATATAMAAPKPLTVWIMPNGASPQETLEKRLELYTKKTGIPTKVQVLDWGEAWNRITHALSNQQEAPDVLQLGTTWTAGAVRPRQLEHDAYRCGHRYLFRALVHRHPSSTRQQENLQEIRHH